MRHARCGGQLLAKHQGRIKTCDTCGAQVDLGHVFHNDVLGRPNIRQHRSEMLCEVRSAIAYQEWEGVNKY